jgi:hypothetical protein
VKLDPFPLLLSTAATAALLASGTPAQTLVRSIPGPAANAQYGKACVVVPDQNGDGVRELMVGAPAFNQERGAIYCVSGAFLAFGTGPQNLWSLTPSSNQGDLFGFAIADVGDETGDGVRDFLVGQPGYDNGFTQDAGAVRLVDGSTHVIVSLIVGPEQADMFGSAIAACGDSNADGRAEVAVGAPGPNSVHSFVYTIGGAQLNLTGAAGALCLTAQAASASQGIGTSIASGADLDGDGYQEFIVGLPGLVNASGGQHAGALLLGTVRPSGTFFYPTLYFSPIAGERLGTSVDMSSDYDGDGVVDIVVGAPNSLDSNGREAGRVAVLSGARLVAGTAPYEIRTLTLPFSSAFFDYHFGAAVCASGDLNNDGVGEILVGAPDYTTIGSGGSILNKGLVSVFSGATGSRFVSIAGSSGDLLGDSIAGAFKDVDNDGFKEFVVAGSRSDVGGTDSGVVKCYRLFPIAPATYCTAKINSLGCSPAIGFNGSPSATSGAAFLITATQFINLKSGLLFYSHKPTGIPFLGGTLCAASPTRRTPVQGSGGSASGADCTGTYSLDFNARIHSGVDGALVAGAEIYAQYWARDPVSASTSSLSNAVRFVINP